MQNLFKVLILVFSLLLFTVAGCFKEVEVSNRGGNTDSTATNFPPPLIIELVRVLLHIEDKNMKAPIEDSALLWNNRGHTAIMAPDGHQVTLGEFTGVTGRGEVVYRSQGTNITLNLQGLIPDGFYSMWVLVFKRPGFHGNFDNLIASSALGLTSSSGENTFVASPGGTASLSAILHPETLSVYGSAGDCLCSEYEIDLIANYHSNNLIPNGTPGDLNSWVTQFFFLFPGRH